MFYQLLKIFAIEFRDVRRLLDFQLSESYYQVSYTDLQKILL